MTELFFDKNNPSKLASDIILFAIQCKQTMHVLFAVMIWLTSSVTFYIATYAPKLQTTSMVYNMNEVAAPHFLAILWWSDQEP